jgi:hypothetical protein
MKGTTMSVDALSTDQPRALVATEREDAGAVAPLDRESAAGALAHVLGTGDLYQLSNEQRVAHYINLCRSQGFNPLTRPYQWIEFKETADSPAVLTLYLKPTGAAQMLRNNHVSVHPIRKEVVGELFVYEVEGVTSTGRRMTASKYVPLTNRYGKLQPRQMSNAFMTAETGAYRRLALAMFGGAAGPDADEAAEWRAVTVDGTGAVLAAPTAEQKLLADSPRTARVIGEPIYEDADVPASGYPDQRPRAEELKLPKRSGPPPSFRATEEDVKRLLGAWFAAVDGSSLDSDDERHRYVEQWTASEGWPDGKRTDSLRTAFSRMTAREAGDFLAHVRALVDDEKRANEEALHEYHNGGMGEEADGEPI